MTLDVAQDGLARVSVHRVLGRRGGRGGAETGDGGGHVRPAMLYFAEEYSNSAPSEAEEEHSQNNPPAHWKICEAVSGRSTCQ